MVVTTEKLGAARCWPSRVVSFNSAVVVTTEKLWFAETYFAHQFILQFGRGRDHGET